MRIIGVGGMFGEIENSRFMLLIYLRSLVLLNAHLGAFLAFIQKLFTIISFFQKLIKGGVGIKAEGLENFSKINKRGGDNYSVLESMCFKQRIYVPSSKYTPSLKTT